MEFFGEFIIDVCSIYDRFIANLSQRVFLNPSYNGSYESSNGW